MLRGPVAVTLLIAAVAGTSACTADADRRAGPVHRTDVTSARALFGAWVDHVGQRSQNVAIRDLEDGLGARLGIRHFYTPWAEDPDPAPLRRAVAAGSVPLVSWNDGPDNAGVAAGNEDRRIRATARMLRDLEARVFFRFGWEMDADGTTGTGSIGPPEDWIAAYRRIHRLIREEAGDRVEFVWCPTVWGFRPGSDRDPADWYPGDDVVDWICADGYNWSDGGDDWESFDEVYRHFFRWARDVDKPIMIGEVGTMEDPGDPDRKARWITEMGWSIKCRHRDVGAVVWFDTDRRRPGEPPRNWRLASSPRSLAAAGDLAADRWFGGPEDTIDCDEPPDGS